MDIKPDHNKERTQTEPLIQSWIVIPRQNIKKRNIRKNKTTQKINKVTLFKKVYTSIYNTSKKVISSMKVIPKLKWLNQDTGAFFYSQRKFAYGMGLAAVLTVSGVYVHDVRPIQGMEVVFGNQTIGFVRSEDQFNRTFYIVANRLREKFGIEIKWDEHPLFISKKIVGSQFTKNEALQNNILKAYDFPVPAAAVVVNGEKVCILPREIDAKNVLDDVLKAYRTNDKIVASFESKVAIEPSVSRPSELTTQNEAVKKLLSKKNVAKEYEIQQNDTIWEIASKNNVSADELLAINHGLTIAVKPGQKIKLSNEQPTVSVRTVEKASYEEDLPYPVKKVNDNSMYIGARTILDKGVEGKRAVEAEITRVDNQEVGRNILKETILKVAKEQTEKVGIKPVAETTGTGRFGRPIYGVITSRFGRRWGSFHSGLDISCAIGSPVNSSDGGKVSFAGWYSGYGNLVIVNHENGYQSYYGHLNKTLVRPGQRIEKGQLIANSGNTGRSTGPHLHFEVRKNGKPVDPQQFLNK